jgi:putative transposase
MGAYRALGGVGVTTRRAAALAGVSRATATRPVPPVLLPSVASAPANQLSVAERARVLAVLTEARFVDASPVQIYAQLLTEGRYLCSVSTMYRLLAANRMAKDRRRLARHQTRARPELIATGPGQVLTWDITKLPGPDKGLYYDAYVMIDIYSRYIVSVAVHAKESGILAKEMMEEVFTLHGVPQVVHADRGTSMTSKTVAAFLIDLNVTRSHSRPRVSNDNPFSEAWFKTLKYAPVFPERFGSLQHARVFMDTFVQFYNHEHHHSGIGLHTPADVHYGLSAATDQVRHHALAAARAATPERFATGAVPKILALPAAAWINPPVADPTALEPDPAAEIEPAVA